MLSNDQTDDEITMDGAPSFSGGQVSNSRPADIQVNEAFLLQNFDISSTGRLTTRRGTSAIGTAFPNPVVGVHYYNTPSLSFLFAIVDDGLGGGVGRIKQWNGSSWIDPSFGRSGSYGLEPVQMVQGFNNMMIAQSGLALAYFNGLGFTGITGGTGRTDSIVHPKYIEWHTDRWVVSGSDADPQNLSFSEYLWPDASSATGWDHVNWDMQVGAGDGEAITGIRSWSESNLVVGKEHSMWLVNCDPLLLLSDLTANVSAFPVKRVHRQIGLLAANTLVQAGADMLFLSDSGVRSLAHTIASDTQDQVGPALSDPIKDIMDRVNTAATKWCSAIYWDDKYFLSLPIDSATYPNYVVVYNKITNSWSGFWPAWQALSMARRIDGSTAKFVMGQASGYVADWRDFVPEDSENDADFQDLGVDYASVLETRALTFGDQDSPKTGVFARSEFRKSKGDVTISAITDGADSPVALAPTIQTSNPGVLVPLTVPFTLPAGDFVDPSLDMMALGQFREARIRIESSAGKVSINKVSAGAFIDTYTIQQ